jgi:gamma-glutamyltranspeptidase/glutathione hydrolase
VATQSPQATQAGVEMLELGGNAVDAAVAAALALGVCEPFASGLGGQTMMLIYQGERVIAIDGSSRAPSLAHPNAIYKGDRAIGYRATTVPSTLATLGYVQKCYGILKWNQVLEPAIKLAEEGYPISELQAYLQQRELENFKKVPSESGAKYFLKDGKPFSPGDIFSQSDLADLLRVLAKKGIKEFYQGKVAKQIDADMRENGGLLRYDDLALIPNPIERTPLVSKFRGLDVYTMPPPGSGRTLLFALNMLNLIPQDKNIQDDITRHILYINILRKAFIERYDRPFDPNYFPQIAEDADMLDPIYTRNCLEEILKNVDESILPFIPSEDELSNETTHLSVMEKSGMAVSLTQSIERVYGSKTAAAGLGFLYNNYMYDYEYKMPQHPFYLRPNVSPWATVAPTLVFDGENPWMALGSPGSERIISALTLFLHHIVDENFTLEEAMKAPRLHCSLGGRVSLEAKRFPCKLIPFLKRKGFRIDERGDLAFYLGSIQAVLRRHDNQRFQGIADIRRDGWAMGV